MFNAQFSKSERGHFILLVLVFSAVFMALLATLSGFIFVQKKVQLAEENKQKAQNLAEAGLEYYRWHLAHYPNDLKDGTGHAGPYVHTVIDPEGETVGTYSLDIGGTVSCGSVTDVAITSTGTSAKDPSFKRTLLARYTRPSVAEFSMIVNSNVWAGADRIISGPYHSNGGIRMDGTHNATVSSGVANWLCTSSFGCSPNSTQNGVFGSGSPQSLWSFPAASIDFNGISIDLAELKDYAIDYGRYLGPSGNYGYRIVMKNNGTFDAYRVTAAQQVMGYSMENGWAQERSVITGTSAPTNYAIPADCPVVFVEDDVWLEGDVSGKVTFAAADVSESAVDRSIIIPADITYASNAAGLTAIGEKDVSIGLNTPNVMEINGIFIAQKGRFGRNHYCPSSCYGSGTPGDTGWRTAGAINVASGWSNLTTTRLATSDNSKASCSATCDDNDDGQMGNFGLSVPAGATITGIEVQVEAAEGASSGNIPTRFSLSWNNGANYTSTKTATVDGTSDANYTLGSSSDTWGRTWSVNDFADGTFRVRIDKATDSDTLSVDRIQIRVHYAVSSFPASLDQYVTRTLLTTNGTVVSNGRVGTKWTSGGTFVSGYAERHDSYDRVLASAPPPFTPATSDDFKFVLWQDQNIPF